MNKEILTSKGYVSKTDFATLHHVSYHKVRNLVDLGYKDEESLKKALRLYSTIMKHHKNNKSNDPYVDKNSETFMNIKDGYTAQELRDIHYKFKGDINEWDTLCDFAGVPHNKWKKLKEFMYGDQPV